MPQLIVTSSTGLTRTVATSAGTSLMEVIRDNGFEDLKALCGGNCSCATCHVYVDDGHFGMLGPLSETEDELLNASNERRPTSRLSCQVVMNEDLDGMAITIAPGDDEG